MDGTRLWKCCNGHVLGYTERVKVVELGITFHETRLNILTHAIAVDSIGGDDIKCVAVGTTRDIKCDVLGCGEKRTWWLGEDALQRMLDRRAAQLEGG